MLLVRVQVRVPSVQIQPPVESDRAVAVSPDGSVRVRTTELKISTVELVSVTLIVSSSALSPCLTIKGLGLKAMERVGTTTGVTKVDKSNIAKLSISICAVMVVEVGHSTGNCLPLLEAVNTCSSLYNTRPHWLAAVA